MVGGAFRTCPACGRLTLNQHCDHPLCRTNLPASESVAKAPARSPYWHGMLCAETRDEIAERMREVIDGRYFTLVSCNSYDENSSRFTGIDVYPSQHLTSPVVADRDRVLPGISWCTQRLSMGVHTRAKTQAEGREGRPHKYVHFTFEPDRIQIDHYAPAGYRLLWIFAVEHHDSEMAGAPERPSS